jgi:hypothetical protein
VLRLRLALVAVALLGCAVVVIVLLRDGSDEHLPVVPTPPGAKHGEAITDPLAWTPERSEEFARRAAAGSTAILYERSPDGVPATAQRVMRFRRQVEAAARSAGVSPDLLEALVFLESAGRPDAQAPGGAASAAGLTQILAETGQNLLGMQIDVDRSASYTRRLQRALGQGNLPRAAALNRARRRVDDRFDPAKQRFGREDLAFVSYHMGMGNLDNVLRDYGGGRVPYVQLYFDSTPQRHAAAYRRLASFGDDSSNYYWKLLAARELMRFARKDPRRLDPSEPTPAGERRALPNTPADTALRAAPGLQLKPSVLATALYIGAQVRAIIGTGTLRVIGADAAGNRFDVSRRYASPRQALAFQYVLDRLQVLNVIDWSRLEDSIAVYAKPDAEKLEPLLDRLGGSTP